MFIEAVTQYMGDCQYRNVCGNCTAHCKFMQKVTPPSPLPFGFFRTMCVAVCSVDDHHKTYIHAKSLIVWQHCRKVAITDICELFKRYSSPVTGPEGSRGVQGVKVPRFRDNGTGWWQVVSLTHRSPLPSGNTPGTHFCQRLSRPQGHSAIGRILCQ